MQDLEQKRKRIVMAVKLAAIPIIGLLVQPFIFLAVKGIIGLIIAGGISLVMINMAPWAGMKLANWRLKALKYEASINPIETLENQYKEREAALITFRDNIKKFHAEVQNFYNELDGFKKDWPESAPRYDSQYANMKMLLNNRGQKYKEAQSNLAQFANVIDQKRAEWKIAQAAAAMTKAANVGEDFMAKLVEDTALDSVQTSLNTAFAELEVSLLDVNDPKVIANAPKGVLADANEPPPSLDLQLEPIKKATA